MDLSKKTGLDNILTTSDLAPDFTGVKKSTSPQNIIKDESNMLQLKQTHHIRNLTISRGGFNDIDQMPDSPIKKFLFIDKMDSTGLQQNLQLHL